MDAATQASNPVHQGGDPLSSVDAPRQQPSDSRLAEDSNAVVCPDWFAKTRRRLLRPDGEPTALARSIAYNGMLFVASFVFVLTWRLVNIFNPTPKEVLLIIGFLTLSVLTFAFCRLVPLLMQVLRPEVGELATMGIAATKISVSALTALERQRKLTRVLQGLSVIFAGFCGMMACTMVVMQVSAQLTT